MPGKAGLAVGVVGRVVECGVGAEVEWATSLSLAGAASAGEVVVWAGLEGVVGSWGLLRSEEVFFGQGCGGCTVSLVLEKECLSAVSESCSYSVVSPVCSSQALWVYEGESIELESCSSPEAQASLAVLGQLVPLFGTGKLGLDPDLPSRCSFSSVSLPRFLPSSLFQSLSVHTLPEEVLPVCELSRVMHF